MLLTLALVTLLGPGPDAADGPDLASEDDRSAWESAGWTDEGPAEPPEPEPTPPTSPESDPPPPEQPGPGAPVDEADAASQSGWDAAGWGSETSTEPPGSAANPSPNTPAPPDADADAWSTFGESDPGSSTVEGPDEDGPTAMPKLKVGDVLAGSLRLTGSFLHFDDEPAVFPDGDDALVLTVGRLLLEADAGEHLHFSFNGFGELSRVPFGAGIGGSFASAGSTASAYRTRFLAWQFWANGSMAGQLGVDWLSTRLSFDPVNIDIGRFPINYSVAGFLTTNDFFAPFAATAVNTIYKPGVDALRVSTGIGATSSVDVVGVLGYAAACNEDLGPLDPCADANYEPDVPTWGRSSVLARAAIVGAGFEWALLGGKVAERWVAGGSLQGNLGPVNLRAEGHVGIPDVEGDGHDRRDRPVYGRIGGGPSMTFAWQNANVALEYRYASDGASSAAGYADYLPSFDLATGMVVEPDKSVFADDLPYLAQHYVALVYGMEIIPIVQIGLTGLVNASDGSGLAGVSVVYSVADESDLILGLFVPWGRGIRNLDPNFGTFDLGSEFGLAPLSAYLEARVFF